MFGEWHLVWSYTYMPAFRMWASLFGSRYCNCPRHCRRQNADFVSRQQFHSTYLTWVTELTTGQWQMWNASTGISKTANETPWHSSALMTHGLSRKWTYPAMRNRSCLQQYWRNWNASKMLVAYRLWYVMQCTIKADRMSSVLKEVQ